MLDHTHASPSKVHTFGKVQGIGHGESGSASLSSNTTDHRRETLGGAAASTSVFQSPLCAQDVLRELPV